MSTKAYNNQSITDSNSNTDSIGLTEREREAIQTAIDNEWECAEFFEPLL